jgi:hypothetical protein
VESPQCLFGAARPNQSHPGGRADYRLTALERYPELPIGSSMWRPSFHIIAGWRRELSAPGVSEAMRECPRVSELITINFFFDFYSNVGNVCTTIL